MPDLPPQDPVQLHGWKSTTRPGSRVLNVPLANELRRMLPERLQIVDDWELVYSLVQDGAMLGTLYRHCAQYTEQRRGQRLGFVLVVRDDEGGVFGAYMSHVPRVSPSYFGNGECFLWRASTSVELPPPPSEDTSSLTRNTMIPMTTADAGDSLPAPVPAPPPPAVLPSSTSTLPDPHRAHTTTTPHQQEQQNNHSSGDVDVASTLPVAVAMAQHLRFTVYPYAAVNDYCMLCQPEFLSLGGGNGKYGLWLDASLMFGHSDPCPTFANNYLSNQGDRFSILAVEVWAVGG